MRARRQIALVALVMFLLGLSSSSLADKERYKVIVHPDNPSDTVSRDFLRDVFLKKKSEWHGHTTRPIDLKHAVRSTFTSDVIRKSSSQLRTYWNQQVFSGKGVPPPVVASSADVVAYVLANKGAIGYVPVSVDTGKARVVSIR